MSRQPGQDRYHIVGYDPHAKVCEVCGKSVPDGLVVLQNASGATTKRAGAGCAAKLSGGRPSVALHRAKKLSLATPSWSSSPEASSYHAPFAEVMERADDLRRDPEFKDWIKDSALKTKKGKPKIFYRGVLRPKRIRKGYRKLSSYTPLPAAAAVYSMASGDYGRYPPIQPRLLKTSTVNPAFICAKNPLHLWGLWCTFGEFIQKLQYGQPNGITDNEVLNILAYLHNREVGAQPGGNLVYKVVDEDGDTVEPDIGDLLRSRTQIASLYYELKEWPSEIPSMADTLLLETYALADAPTTSTVAKRLGYDAIIHTDPFHPGQASEILFDKSEEDLLGVDSDYNMNDDEVTTIQTVRPFAFDQVRSIIPGGVSTTTFLHGLPGVPKTRRPPKKHKGRRE